MTFFLDPKKTKKSDKKQEKTNPVTICIQDQSL